MIFVPQFGLLNAFGAEFRWKGIVFCYVFLSVSVFSHINGLGTEMFWRSRSEYIVNRLVSTFFGWLFVDILLAVFQNELIGRAVFGVGVLSDALLASVLTALLKDLAKSSRVVVLVSEMPEQQLALDLTKAHYDVLRLAPSNLKKPLNRDASVRPMIYVVCGRVGFENHLIPCFTLFGRNVMSLSVFQQKMFHRIPLDGLSKLTWWNVNSKLNSDEFAFFKRCCDISVAVFGILLAVPVILVVWLIYKLGDSGPVIYTQVRQGQFGNPFRIYKIRSMRIDSEKGGAKWASKNDDRVTKVGGLLRRTRLDELPQFFNVLKGDMSFIGPRPERPELAQKVEQSVPEFSLRLAAKPGITGWAQVNYPYGASIEDSIKKLEYDAYYILNASILFEARITLRTILAMVKGAR